ncbi:MAG TPA: TraB/GumN family protein [Casimicrobiaceae bacterium]|nr:TraB/GumN family protein [Casimicrobiaceae bacterium]
MTIVRGLSRVAPASLCRWRRIVVATLAASAFAADAASFSHGRLFRVDRPGVSPSYVFGTLHSNDARVTALPTPVTTALAASRTAAFETLLLDADRAAFLAASQTAHGLRLSDHVDTATFERIARALEPQGIDRALLERAKPWAALLMLAQGVDDGQASVDGELLARARARGLSLVGLELPDEQVAALDGIPLESRLALVRWARDTQHDRKAQLETTTRAWLAGDLRRLKRQALEPPGSDPRLAAHFRSLYGKLITDRNVLMAHRLHLPLTRGRVFVAVGALHLEGRNGLLALIEAQGYRITRVL